MNKQQEWINKNGEDILLTGILLVTLVLFNFFTKIFTIYLNKPAYAFGKIEVWFTPLVFSIGLLLLFILIFFEIKLMKDDRKLLKKLTQSWFKD